MKRFFLPAALLLIVLAIGCTAETPADGGGTVDQPDKEDVVVTPLMNVLTDVETYANQTILVNGTLNRRKSGSLYFWYIVDRKDYSLSLERTGELEDLYDQQGEAQLMLRGDVILESGRAKLSSYEIVTPDYDSYNYIKFCADGTQYWHCAAQKPGYCADGSLVENASFCGCPEGQVVQADTCILQYEVGPAEKRFNYTMLGSTETISATLYQGVVSHLGGLEEPDSHPGFMQDSVQDQYTNIFLDVVRSLTTSRNTRLRIVVNMVQNMELDDSGGEKRYPYEVLYNGIGTDAEKARLLAYLLREIGMGTAILEYPGENRTAAGVECPDIYDLKNTGYCFIEPSVPSIITDYRGNYVGAVALTSDPEIVEISEGYSFDDVSDEYMDTQEWNRIGTLSETEAENMGMSDYSSWNNIVLKYGLETVE